MPPTSTSSSAASFNPGLNAGASSFSFGAPRTTAVISGKAPSKALKIKPPPSALDKEKAEKEKAEKDRSDKEKSDKEAAQKEASNLAGADQSATEKKRASEEKEVAEQAKAADEKSAADENLAAVNKKVADEKRINDQKIAEQKLAAHQIAQAKAAAEANQKAQQEEEDKLLLEKEKAELEKKVRDQEEEARRVREKHTADEKAAQELKDVEAKRQAEENAAIAVAAAEAERKRIEDEQIPDMAASAAKESEQATSAPLSRQTSSQASTDEPSAPATPAGEFTSPPVAKRAVPEPLDLSSSKVAVSDSKIVAPGSSLSSAHPITDLKLVSYPDSVKSSNPDLNVNAKPGKFRYDRDFLLQFMEVCKEKPEQLPSLEAIGMTDEGPTSNSGAVGMPRSASYGGKTRVGSVPSTPLGPRGTVPPNFNRAASTSFAGMGNFTGGMPGATSEQRFAASNAAAQGGAVGGFALPGKPGAMARTPSAASGPGGVPMGGSSGRGIDRSSGRGQRRRPGERGPPPTQSVILSSEFAPLETSENRWTPSVQAGPTRRRSARICGKEGQGSSQQAYHRKL